MKFIIGLTLIAFCIELGSTDNCCATVFQAGNYDLKGFTSKRVCGEVANVGVGSGAYLGISSLKLDPGCVIEAFKKVNFEGDTKTFTADTPNVGDWNDLIQSLKVRSNCCATVFQAGSYNLNGFTSKRVCGEVANVGVGSGAYLGISSLKLDPGCVVEAFKKVNFEGDTKTFTVDTPNVGDWNDLIQSLKVRSKCCATVFQAGSFNLNGFTSKKVCGAVANVGIGSGAYLGISSLKIDPGCVIEAFKQINYAGDKKIYTTETGDLADWNDKIQSMYVRAA